MPLPTCPESFTSHRHAAAWMIRLGRALLRSNGNIAEYISREDNNRNFDDGYRLIAIGQRIASKYGTYTREDRLRERLRQLLKKTTISNP